MSMKQNAALVLTALHGDLTKISRKGEYFAQLCGRHLSVLEICQAPKRENPRQSSTIPWRTSFTRRLYWI